MTVKTKKADPIIISPIQTPMVSYLDGDASGGIPELTGHEERPSSPRTEVVTITPALAKSWLSRNITNRAIKQRQIAALAKVIQLGQWDACNGETIILSERGEVLDGQHRLTAVVVAGHPIVSLVVFGIDATKRGTIDTGYKRTFADFLTMHGEGNASTLAAACHVLHGYEEGTLRSLQRGMPFLSYETGMSFLEAHPLLRVAAPQARQFSHLVPTSWGTALFSLMLQRDPLLAESCRAVLASGDLAAEYPTLHRVRERLIKNGISQAKLPHFSLAGFVAKAWNATRLKKSLKTFKMLPEEDFPLVQ